MKMKLEIHAFDPGAEAQPAVREYLSSIARLMHTELGPPPADFDKTMLYSSAIMFGIGTLVAELERHNPQHLRSYARYELIPPLVELTGGAIINVNTNLSPSVNC